MTPEMNSHSISWTSTLVWLATVCSIYVGFLISGKLARAGKGFVAATVPLWIFAPTALIAHAVGSELSNEDIWIILGFAGVLALVTWGHLRQAR